MSATTSTPPQPAHGSLGQYDCLLPPTVKSLEQPVTNEQIKEADSDRMRLKRPNQCPEV